MATASSTCWTAELNPYPNKMSKPFKMTRSFFIACFSCLTVVAGAQQAVSLQQCIDTALARNIAVRQSNLNMQTAAIDLSQARMNQLPTVNAEVDHGMNAGRSIDPFTNTYVNQS